MKSWTEELVMGMIKNLDVDVMMVSQVILTK